MAEHKNQHFIPQFYLKAWCDPDTPPKQTPYVWVFSKDGSQVKKKAPENIFKETDMYTIIGPQGERDLTLEHGLNELETQFSSIRDKKILKKVFLTPHEHFVCCAFIAATFARTKARREHHAETWRESFEQGEIMKKRVANMTPEQRKNIRSEPKGINKPTLSHEEVKKIAENPLQELLAIEINTLASNLFRMDFIFIETSDKYGFITSDNPCVPFDPEGYKRPPFYQGPALMYETLEITMPISPNFMILFNWKRLNGYGRINEISLDELNRRTRFHAHEYFVTNANFKKQHWFDPGVEPDDSWDKLNPEPTPFWEK